MEWKDGLPTINGMYFTNDATGVIQPYIFAGVHSISWRGKIKHLGPITPEMIEAWDPIGRQMSRDLLTEIYQTACLLENAAAELIKQAEAGETITCPTCGCVLESSLELRYCDYDKPVCTQCTGGDTECLICLECGEVTTKNKSNQTHK
jgi:hypothetical protein